MLPGDLWDPQLTIVNVAGDFDQERRSFVVRYENGYKGPVVLHRWRFKGLFREVMELQYFPFDVQVSEPVDTNSSPLHLSRRLLPHRSALNRNCSVDPCSHLPFRSKQPALVIFPATL